MERGGKTSAADDVDAFCINVWSGPRSLSTTLLYSFAQRDDTEVLDEPLYAHWLRVSGAQRPYKDKVMETMDSDGNRVVQNVIYKPRKKKVLFVKHMSKFRTPDLTSDVIRRGAHMLLIRDPIELLPSFDKVVPVTLEETGLPALVQLFDEVRKCGKTPLVVDASFLRNNPEATLCAICTAFNISFQDSMLKWDAGPRPEDGAWAPWWYSNVHKSTGFAPKQKWPAKAFPLELYDLLEECMPFYTLLSRHAIRPLAQVPPPLPNPLNSRILVWVGNGLVPRDSAAVSVLDSAVQGGDGVWEGIRIYNGRVFKLEEHLDRLFDSAKAMAFTEVPAREEVMAALFSTLIANGMRNNAHVRLTLTRGKKVTSGMSPLFNKYGPTLIVLAEWKKPVYDNDGGITLITSSIRRNSPQSVDSKIHHTNLINNILAKVESNLALADDAIMLDADGFVAETNATNIFLVKQGRVLTPTADYCLPGVTRATVITLVGAAGVPMIERRISISEFHSADEVFTTGSMGELSPVMEIDGRTIGNGTIGPMTRRLQAMYAELTTTSGVEIPEPVAEMENPAPALSSSSE